MATDTSASKAPIVMNGNGKSVTTDEEGAPAVQSAAAVVREAVPAPELSILARGDSGSGRWIIGGDAEVLGQFSGDIECAGDLLIGKGAELSATIRGADVTIAGLVRGNITVLGRLKITASGRLEGDARVGSLVVQEGGVHHGVIRVHPEGVPEVAEPFPEATPAIAQGVTGATPVDRVKKFWGEFF